MIDTDKYEGHSDYNIYDRKGNTIFFVDDVGSNMATLNLLADAPLLLAEVKRLQKENKKQLDVLSTLDEMIRHRISHVKMMKALEQGLDLPETWKEMIE